MPEPRESDDAARTRITLRIALNEWLASASFRDLDRHMAFYPPTVSVFFLDRHVSRAAVRAEKDRVFGHADRVELTASEPTITLSPDRRRAVMRFRKQYVIAGPGVNRRGEVLQELVWVRTPEGWRIDGERDVAVLRGGRSG